MKMNSKKKSGGRLGKSLIILGLLLIATALFLTCKNIWDISKAGADSNSVLDKLVPIIEDATGPSAEEEVPDYILNPEMDMPVKVIDGVEYIGTISIEKTGVTLPIALELNRKNLKTSPCRYKGSAYKDDLIIAAHNYPSHFGKIKYLEIGDAVVIKDMDGNEFDYQVVSSEILKGTDIEQMMEGDWDLTVFTCTIGGRNRVTVRCERVI